jgi:hypothetical protein
MVEGIAIAGDDRLRVRINCQRHQLIVIGIPEHRWS